MNIRSSIKTWYDRLSSMRFAVGLLITLAVASVIGTVLKQNQPQADYLLQFGPFWFEWMDAFGLFDVYHAGWFLGILFFLVLSTGLCLYRNTPLMLREMRQFREHVQETSLRAFAHRAEFRSHVAAAELVPRVSEYLAAQGFRAKVMAMESNGAGADQLIAAKAGSHRRLGYLLTHTAIVVICLGGLIDGNLPLRAQQWLGHKQVETRSIPHDQVPSISRLSPANLSFRGNISISEGGSANVVYLNASDGYLVQELPFAIALKKFHIEHYPTGQPKSFASDLVITDPESGKSFEHTISVNHPLIYRGIAIYQASFDDGGTKVSLNGWDLLAPDPRPIAARAQVGYSALLSHGRDRYTIEVTGFRPINVEGIDDPPPAVPARTGLAEKVMGAFGSGARGDKRKAVHNVGPSFQYKVRDAQGQAREYSNYMQPTQLDGRWYLLSGMRAAPNEPFRYMRFPLDGDSALAGFMELRAALLDRALHGEIARRVAARALPDKKANDTGRVRLAEKTAAVLGMFADGGYDALGRFIKENIPRDKQRQAARAYIGLLEEAALDAHQLMRARAGKPAAAQTNDTLRFVRDSLDTVSDTRFYGAPVYLQLMEFDEVKATGLQLTRSPGRNLVYGGSALLVLGIFAMFYVRERRLWLLLKPQSGKALFAMSGNRPTLDFEREFARHKEQIGKLIKE